MPSFQSGSRNLSHTSPAGRKIALIDRGVCSFTTKIRNAQNAGAIGVLVVNNVARDPTAMGHDGTNPRPTIPAAMLSAGNVETVSGRQGARADSQPLLHRSLTDYDAFAQTA